MMGLGELRRHPPGTVTCLFCPVYPVAAVVCAGWVEGEGIWGGEVGEDAAVACGLVAGDVAGDADGDAAGLSAGRWGPHGVRSPAVVGGSAVRTVRVRR